MGALKRNNQFQQGPIAGIGAGRGNKVPKLIKELRGTVKPGVDGPIGEPDPGSGSPLLEEPPIHLSQRELHFYKKLDDLIIPGLTCEEDSFALATFATIIARIENGSATGSDHNLALKYFQLFAMTPSSRAKLGHDRRQAAKKPKGFGEFAK